MVETLEQYGIYSGNLEIVQNDTTRGICAHISVLSKDEQRIEKSAWINEADLLVRMIILNEQQGYCWVRYVNTNGPSKRIIAIPEPFEYERIACANPLLVPEKKKRKSFTKNTAAIYVNPISGVINIKRAVLDLIRDGENCFSYALLLSEGDDRFIRFIKEHQSGAISLSRGKNNTVKISGKDDILRWLTGFCTVADAEDYLIEIDAGRPETTIKLIPNET